MRTMRESVCCRSWLTRCPCSLRGGIAVVAALLLLAGCAGTPERAGDNRQDAQASPVTAVRAPVEPLTEPQAQLLVQAREAARAEDWPVSTAALSELAAARPDLAWVQSRLAWVYQQQGEIERAQGLYRQAVGGNPADALTVNNLALLLQRQGEFAEARDLLEQGLTLSPEVPELHYNLAVLSELYLLDLEAALIHYRRYQQLTGGEDQRVTGWIADLERRVE